MTDWTRFAARVPAGTVARSVWQFDVVLLENYPYAAIEANIKHRADWERCSPDHQEMSEDNLKCQRIDSKNLNDSRLQTFIHLDCLTYLIDGQWLSYQQIMEG